MAKVREEKNYEIEMADGKFIFRMTRKSADGRMHSITVPYPLMIEKKRLTKKQTETYCLDYARGNGWLELDLADGKPNKPLVFNRQ